MGQYFGFVFCCTKRSQRVELISARQSCKLHLFFFRLLRATLYCLFKSAQICAPKYFRRAYYSDTKLCINRTFYAMWMFLFYRVRRCQVERQKLTEMNWHSLVFQDTMLERTSAWHKTSWGRQGRQSVWLLHVCNILIQIVLPLLGATVCHLITYQRMAIYLVIFIIFIKYSLRKIFCRFMIDYNLVIHVDNIFLFKSLIKILSHHSTPF